MHSHPLLIILGPTASGKTRLAVQTAALLNGEIISADSRQVFRGMDIGTGKDLTEYRTGAESVPVHLIDIRDPGEKFNVNIFKDEFYSAVQLIRNKGKLPILCGGTGMYIHSLLQQHDFTAIPVDEALRSGLSGLTPDELRTRLEAFPAAFTAHADRSSAKRMIRAIEIAAYLQRHEFVPQARPELDPLIIGLDAETGLRWKRIQSRLEQRFNEGLIAEVEALLAAGFSPDLLISYGLEYKFITFYLQKKISLSELKTQLYIGIRQFAKRQMTFFRKMEKDGIAIEWLDAATDIALLCQTVVSRCAQKYTGNQL